MTLSPLPTGASQKQGPRADARPIPNSLRVPLLEAVLDQAVFSGRHVLAARLSLHPLATMLRLESAWCAVAASPSTLR